MSLSERRTQRIAARVIIFGTAFLVFGGVVTGMATFSSTQRGFEEVTTYGMEIEAESLNTIKTLPPFSLEIPQEEVTQKLRTVLEPVEEEPEQLSVLHVVEEQKEYPTIVSVKVQNLASNGKEYPYYEFYEVDKTRVVLSAELQEYLYELCIEFEIEEHFKLLMCQFFSESRFQEKLISATSDYGIAQINTCNHSWLKKQLNITNFLDAKQSLYCGTYMMSGYLKKYSPGVALGKYNTGRAFVNSYAKKILNLYNDENRVQQIEKEEV